MRTYKKSLQPFARKLRSNMTDAELLLWSRLRRRQICVVQFYRQKPIGPYIVDFYAPAAALVIEVDGRQHYDPVECRKDATRDTRINSHGLQVLRFTNLEVLQELEAVLERIRLVVARRAKIPL